MYIYEQIQKKDRIDENIRMENQCKYFIDLLEGTKKKKVIKIGEKEGIEERRREKDGGKRRKPLQRK